MNGIKSRKIWLVCVLLVIAAGIFACRTNEPLKDCFFIDNDCKFDLYVSISEMTEYEPQNCYTVSAGKSIAVENILGYYTIWTRSMDDSSWYSTTIYVKNNSTLAVKWADGRYEYHQKI